MKFILGTVSSLAIVGSLTAFASYFTVDEGHVGVVTRFNKAIYQVGPGLHFKRPFIDGVEHIEVRERLNEAVLSSATRDELPISVTATMNWSINPTAAMDLFVRYGGVEQFETRIIDPMFAQATKAAIAQFSASELITNREGAVVKMMAELEEAVSRLPITVTAPNIPEIALPESYRNAILEKEKARQERDAEQLRLERQALVVQQTVQTARAEADAARARAEARAFSITAEAEAQASANLSLARAEAEGLREIAAALSENETLVTFEQAKRWNGALPQTVLGDKPEVMMMMGGK